jgi:hypothetical protein
LSRYLGTQSHPTNNIIIIIIIIIIIVAGFPPRQPGSSHVGFVVDKVALEQAFSEFFGSPCQSSFHQLLHNHYHLSFGAGRIGQ